MDEKKTITPLESATVVACLRGIAANMVPLVSAATGKAFDIEIINEAIEHGVTLVFHGIAIYYFLKAIRGRISATQVIEKKE